MRPYYSIQELAHILDGDIHSVADGLAACGIAAFHGGKPADLSRWRRSIIDHGNGNIYITTGLRIVPDPDTVVVSSDALPESWRQSIEAACRDSDATSVQNTSPDVTPGKGGAPEITATHDEDTLPTGTDDALAALFDPVRAAQLEAMFPYDGKWASYAERSRRNGLKDAAKVGTAQYNPYRAAIWWLNTGPVGWKWERCLRVLANNLPPRSIDSKHLLTGEYE